LSGPFFSDFGTFLNMDNIFFYKHKILHCIPSIIILCAQNLRNHKYNLQSRTLEASIPYCCQTEQVVCI